MLVTKYYMYLISWVFENYFKQIQNQQEAGIQDGIRSPCSQIVSKNLLNSRVNACNKISLKFHENCGYFENGSAKNFFWTSSIFFGQN